MDLKMSVTPMHPYLGGVMNLSNMVMVNLRDAMRKM